MSVARTENNSLAADGEDNLEGSGLEPAALLATARDKVTDLVKQHPVATLLGAFAVGFAVARVIRALGED
jgi:hypothetical protein